LNSESEEEETPSPPDSPSSEPWDYVELPPRPNRVDSAAIYDFLSVIAKRFIYSVDLQSHMAESILFIRDEVVSLGERQKSLSKRVRAIEESVPKTLPVQSLQNDLKVISDKIDSISSSVSSLHFDVVSSMESGDTSASDRLEKIAAHISAARAAVSELADE
jgi:hypothetical protein